MAHPDRPQVTIWRMLIALRVPKAIKTVRICDSFFFHDDNGYANASQSMSPVLLQSLTSAGHVTFSRPRTLVQSPLDRQRCGVWPQRWRNPGPAEEPNSSSSSQAFVLLPAPTRFQMPPLGGDGQCVRTLKNAKRLDGWVNTCKRAVFWLEWINSLLSQNAAGFVITRNRKMLSHQTKR
jgi:hypothetical protein